MKKIWNFFFNFFYPTCSLGHPKMPVRSFFEKSLTNFECVLFVRPRILTPSPFFDDILFGLWVVVWWYVHIPPPCWKGSCKSKYLYAFEHLRISPWSVSSPSEVWVLCLMKLNILQFGIFSFAKIMANSKAFSLDIFIKHKAHISEKCFLLPKRYVRYAVALLS